jgi:hypothetical protein
LQSLPAADEKYSGLYFLLIEVLVSNENLWSLSPICNGLYSYKHMGFERKKFQHFVLAFGLSAGMFCEKRKDTTASKEDAGKRTSMHLRSIAERQMWAVKGMTLSTNT